jgi:hypothetical protein
MLDPSQHDQTCVNCRFMAPREGYAVCRRYPPTVNPPTIGGLSGFPTVHPTDTWQQAPGA